MANYGLTVTSKFKPFSFQEYIAPYQIYGQAFKEQQDALAELNAKASIWEGMANRVTDKEAYAQYKKYAEDLRAQANEIAANGLNTTSRQKMLDLKARYAAEITPIENAYNARLEDYKRQIAINEQSGGNTLYNKWANTASLDEYLNGNRPNYITSNLKDVYEEAVAGAAGISGRYFSEPQLKELNNQYYNYVNVKGLSTDRALAQLEEDNSAFSQLVQAMRARRQYDKYDAKSQGRMDATIRQGVLTGLISKVDNSLQANHSYTLDESRREKKVQGYVLNSKGDYVYSRGNDQELKRDKAHIEEGTKRSTNSTSNKPTVDPKKTPRIHSGSSGVSIGANDSITTLDSNNSYTSGDPVIWRDMKSEQRAKILKILKESHPEIYKALKNGDTAYSVYYNKNTKNYVILKDGVTMTAEDFNNISNNGNAAKDDY